MGAEWSGWVLVGRYRRVEVVGITIGALLGAVVHSRRRCWLSRTSLTSRTAWPTRCSYTAAFLTLLAANVGAVIMPWMVFYQQGAMVDKGRRGLTMTQALRSARLDTAVGSVRTQLVMIAIIVAVAATIGAHNPGAALGDIGAIAQVLVPFLGRTTAIVLFGLGMIGAAVVAAFVVALAGAWGMAEVLGWRHSLNDSPPTPAASTPWRCWAP